jgi:ADP-ribose pyrophosphatase YjhB (NUDIX family)
VEALPPGTEGVSTTARREYYDDPDAPAPMETHESLTDSVVREVREETGYDVEVTGLVGTYTDPRHIIAYTDGEVRRQFNICYTAKITGGELAISSESTEVQFVEAGKLDDLPMHATQRLRLRHYLDRNGQPYLG